MKKLLVLSLLLSGCTMVGPQERGIRLHAGAVDGVLESGPHVWFPVLMGSDKVNLSIQKQDVKTSAASKDLQEITTEVAVNWLINKDNVLEVYKTLGNEEQAFLRIVEPSVNEVLKSAMSKLTAEEILSQRLKLKEDIDIQLKTRLSKYGLILQDVSIVNLHFTVEFSKAIEEKQIAEQKSQQAHYVADQAKQDAVARVNKAKGEAEAALTMATAQSQAQKLLQLTLTDKVLRLEYLKKWDGVLPSVLTGNGSSVMLNIPNVSKEEK